MYVKSIELFNIKSYPSLKLDLSENINILVGANNSGKSSIIRSVLNLQYPAFTSADIRSQENDAKIFTTVTDVDSADNRAFYNPRFHSQFENAKGYHILWHLGIVQKSPKEDYLYVNSAHKVKELPHKRVKITDKKGKEVDLKDFRRFPDQEDEAGFIYPFLSKRKSEYFDQNISKEQTYKIQEGLRNLPAKIQKISNPSHPKFDEFLRLCEDILGFRIGVLPAGQQGANGIEVGSFVTNNEVIPLKLMGDGVMNIVAFIATLLIEDRKLFLVEELENDIHPSALKKLLDLIVSKSSDNQFIISTHSHIVLRYLGVLPKTKIFYVQWATKLIGNSKAYVPTSTVKEIDKSPEARMEILSLLGYEFHDFDLYESYLLLEESSAETVIAQFIIPNIVPELINKIKTIAARGVDDLKVRAVDFGRLFVFVHTNPIYKKRAWIVADGDDAGKATIDSLRKAFSSWPSEHFVNFSKGNFEYYYPDRFQEKVNAVLKLKGSKRAEGKRKLLLDVMEWSLKNREVAINEFNVSATEVISILRKISRTLKR
ncbi:hypothetical protein WSM22_40530 [Cytophagales bacterium WSM2-2]|nr:hypothetical protein WSM22_40530 [Cytophagales bacterium WSM2-2]